MALSKEVKVDKIEVVGDYKAVQCREATIVSEDGVELTRSFHRHVLHPDSDISGEPQETQDVCNAVWTDAVKAAWFLFQHKYPSGDPSTDWELAQLQKYCDDNSVDYEDGTNLDEDGNAIAANSKAELVELIEAE
jgi:PAB1-binding protein PBP1